MLRRIESVNRSLSGRVAVDARRERRGAVVVFAAVLIVVLLAMIAFALDMGYIVLVRTQLQTAADSAALAGASVVAVPSNVFPTAQQYAKYHKSSQTPIDLAAADVLIGLWDSTTRTF